MMENGLMFRTVSVHLVMQLVLLVMEELLTTVKLVLIQLLLFKEAHVKHPVTKDIIQMLTKYANLVIQLAQSALQDQGLLAQLAIPVTSFNIKGLLVALHVLMEIMRTLPQTCAYFVITLVKLVQVGPLMLALNVKMVI
jgi:hypothetical protein